VPKFFLSYTLCLQFKIVQISKQTGSNALAKAGTAKGMVFAANALHITESKGTCRFA